MTRLLVAAMAALLLASSTPSGPPVVAWVNGAWFDDGRPWAVFDSEAVVYNVAVDTSFAANGP